MINLQNSKLLSKEIKIIPKYLKCVCNEVLQCALILGSAIKNFESAVIATVKNVIFQKNGKTCNAK
jgi:hypothetical protein